MFIQGYQVARSCGVRSGAPCRLAGWLLPLMLKSSSVRDIRPCVPTSVNSFFQLRLLAIRNQPPGPINTSKELCLDLTSSRLHSHSSTTGSARPSHQAYISPRQSAFLRRPCLQARRLRGSYTSRSSTQRVSSSTATGAQVENPMI